VGFSRNDVSKLGKALISARKATATARHKAGEGVRDLVHIGVAGATSAAFGYWAGAKAKKAATDPTIKTGPSFGPVPADLGLAIALEGAALMGVGGKESSDYMKTASLALFSCYASTMGYEYGKGRAAGDSAWQPRAVLGRDNKALPAGSVQGAGLTADYLTRLANQD
jgi:hypothetical protein